MSAIISPAMRNFSAPTQLALGAMFQRMADSPYEAGALRIALDLACRDAHEQAMSRAQVVSAFRFAFDRVRRPIERQPADWEREFRRALGTCLETYFA